MEEIKAPKKERKFLKAIGNIGKILAEELVMGIARKFIGKAIDKVGNKKQGLIIAFIILASSYVFAQFPSTGNKQRLGFQTTADGLVWRGSLSDTASIQPVSNQNAWVILDTVNFKFYSFDFTSNVWNQLPSGTTIDTASLSNRINLKLNISDTAAMLLPYFKDADTSLLNLVTRFGLKVNISDTAAMLLPYAKKSYVDTAGRFYARQDFTNVSSSTLTWTQSDTLVVGGTGVVQVYRNGQILLPTQYTIPTNASVVIGSTAYKLGENYTVIFPKGGGGSGSGGSGSLTSISAGTGITVSPNPITTTGTVSADLSVLMELTDTSLLNLTTRFASKLNTTDTASLSTRINAKGTGTVTSVGSGFGLLGGTITTTGTLRLDSSAVFTRIRDSIVDVAIGNDTIKILKQEYAPALTSVLTWTITPKFPIQLKAYILVFRNGQLMNNDQYNLTDTNKITIVSTSFKIGANYTVATVSGIGSVGSAQAGNPVYPDAGIALSTGSTWASSITNNSSNWNTAFTDRLKWDGGSTDLNATTGRASLGGTTIGQSMFTLTNPSAITFPRFNTDNTVSALTAANFRSAIGAGTVTTVNAASTAGNPISIDNNTTTPTIELLSATSARNGYLTSTDWTTFNNKQSALGFTPANSTITIATTAPLQGGGNLTANRTLSMTQATTSADGFLTSTDWTTFNGKQNALVSGTTIKTVNGTTLLGSGNLSVGTLVGTDTVSLSNRINLKLNPSDTVSLSNRINLKFNTADTSQLNLTSRFAAKLNYTDTSFLFTQSDTNQLNLTNRFASKQNTISLTTTGTSGAATLVGSTLNIPQYSGGGGGTGTVTSVGLTAPSIFTVSGSPVTTSGTLALTYSGTALPLLNGGTGATTADGALTNLGATAQGKLLFGLTNTVSEKFIKVNTDNTITLLNAADTRTAIGASARGGNTFTLTDISSISFLRYNADNTVSQRAADGMRSDLGGTTIGQSMFTLTNPSAITFPRFNADNTVSSLNAADFRTAIGAGTGTVTSVTGSLPISSSGGATPNITIANAAISTTGVVTASTQTFGGAKTFNGVLNASSDLNVTGIASLNGGVIISPASSMTKIAGLNASNAIGSITVGTGLSLASGTLTATAGNYTRYTGTSITVPATDKYVDIHNSGTVTLTLPNAADYTGKEIVVKNSITTLVRSATSNIISFALGNTPAVTTILSGSTEAKFAVLVSDGTYWRILQAN